MEECESCSNQPQIISVNDFMAMHKQKMLIAERGYVESLKNALEELKKLVEKKDKDRMEYAFLLTALITIMAGSIRGWTKWCTIEKINGISKDKENFGKMVEEMTELVTKWIKIDIEITNKSIEKMEADCVGKPTKPKKKSKKPSIYT